MNSNGHQRSPSPLSPSRHFRGNGSALGLPSSTIRKTPGVKTVPVDAVMSSMAMEIEMAAINSSLPPGVQPRTGSNSSNDEVAPVTNGQHLDLRLPSSQSTVRPNTGNNTEGRQETLGRRVTAPDTFHDADGRTQSMPKSDSTPKSKVKR